MATIAFGLQFRAVADWSGRTGRAAAFPTCVQQATADPYIFDHTVAVLRAADVTLQNVTAGQLGLDPTVAASDPQRWRDVFTSANAYAHAQGYFHGFPTLQRTEAAGGARFGVVLLRSTGPGPAGNGITWQDIPATEVFPEFPVGSAAFMSLPGSMWLQRLDAWATAHGHGAALPTGWTARYAGEWVVGAVLFEPATVSRLTVSGAELEFHQELCAKEANWSEPQTATGPVRVIASSDSVAYPAPLAVDESPFGDPLFAEAGKVAYFRCVARRAGSCVVAIFAKGPDAVRLIMRPRQDNRSLVFFGNGASKGAWIVAHRFNFTTNEGMGEVVSFYRLPGASAALAFELTSGTAGPGQIQAHTVGFVKQGLFGIALPIMSFAWSSFMGLSPGMDLTFTWVSP